MCSLPPDHCCAHTPPSILEPSVQTVCPLLFPKVVACSKQIIHDPSPALPFVCFLLLHSSRPYGSLLLAKLLEKIETRTLLPSHSYQRLGISIGKFPRSPPRYQRSPQLKTTLEKIGSASKSRLVLTCEPRATPWLVMPSCPPHTRSALVFLSSRADLHDGMTIQIQATE